MFAPLLEAGRFVRDVSLIETPRRPANDSANQSVEEERENYTRSFSFRHNGMCGRHFQSGRGCSPGETLVRLDMSDRHGCRREFWLLYSHATSFAQLS